MIVGNMQYELLPAQIERVVNPDGTLAEEVRYMLPLAIALSASSIAAALEASRRRNDATA
jgi:hypothetical protein